MRIGREIGICLATSLKSRLAQLVERVTSNDEVSRSSRLMGIIFWRSRHLCRIAHHGRCVTAGETTPLSVLTLALMRYLRLTSSILLHKPNALLPCNLHFVMIRYASSTPSRKPISGATLLSQALDQKRRSARGEDSVGPFRLGLIPPTPQDVGEVKKWSELSTSGKGE